LIGKSDAIKRVLKDIESVAPSNSSVVITGESGTGKELVAKAIHSILTGNSSHWLVYLWGSHRKFIGKRIVRS